MRIFYQVAVIVGIIVVYGVITVLAGFGLTVMAIKTGLADNEGGDRLWMITSYILGAIAFIALAVFTVAKFDLWNATF